MAMLKTVLMNLLRPSRTRAPLDMPSLPSVFRGVIAHKAELCTGCQTCSYVCAPKAITFASEPGVSVTWSFFAGKCSFCGLCQAYCPTKAITNTTDLPVVGGDQVAHHFESVMPLQRCSRCGTAHIPVPSASLPNISQDDLDLCWECRRKQAGERIRDAFTGKMSQAAGGKTDAEH